jgi:hypothetical protein
MSESLDGYRPRPKATDYLLEVCHSGHSWCREPTEGSIAAAIENNLDGGKIKAKVIEFNWNKIAKQTLHERNLSWGAIKDVAVCLAKASLSLEPITPERGSRPFERVVSSGEILFQISEAAMALWFTTLFFIVPILTAIPYFDNSFNYGDTPKGAFQPILRSVLNGTALVLISTLVGFLLSAALLSICSCDPNNVGGYPTRRNHDNPTFASSLDTSFLDSLGWHSSVHLENGHQTCALIFHS